MTESGMFDLALCKADEKTDFATSNVRWLFTETKETNT